MRPASFNRPSDKELHRTSSCHLRRPSDQTGHAHEAAISSGVLWTSATGTVGPRVVELPCRPSFGDAVPRSSGRRWTGLITPPDEHSLRAGRSVEAGDVAKKSSPRVWMGVNISASTTTSAAVPTPTFEGMVATDRRRLYTLALSILRDEGEAEDAVQETLLKAWRSWSTLSHANYVSRWLTRVCVNHCISRRRFLRLRGWPQLELFERAGASDDESGRAEVLDIDRVYRRLSPKQRAAITLSYRYGYSVEECAGFMECRPRTVRTHLTRGLATLRKELSDD